MRSRRQAIVAVPVLLAAMWTVAALPWADAAEPAARAKPSASSRAPVDLNEANAEQLTAVPGIGETLAARIVAFREEHGPFRRVEDLLKVRGIGEKSFQKLRPHVTVKKRD